MKPGEGRDILDLSNFSISLLVRVMKIITSLHGRTNQFTTIRNAFT